MKIRAKDIASKLSISPATVSLVLNNRPGVSEKTRKLVLNAIKEEGYYPTTMPLNTKNKHGNIQFVVYKKRNLEIQETSFFSELVEGIDREARNAGYNLGLTFIDEEKDDVSSVLQEIKGEKPNGILVLATEMSEEDLKIFETLHLPMIFIDNCFDENSNNIVCIDNVEGVFKAIGHLSDLGHKQIGYLHSSVNIHNFEQRLYGINLAVKKYGCTLLPEHVFTLSLKTHKPFYHVIMALKDKEAPTALFADNDNMAFEAIKALKAHGIMVPRDVSIVGFDDMPLCEMIEPKLTTIRVFKEHLGRLAMKRLVEVIEEKSIERIKCFVGTELIVRDSTIVYSAIL